MPHRHFVLAIPKMLRPYFQRHRRLLTHLCVLAKDSLIQYLRAALDLPDGVPAMIFTIHTFGEYLDFHPHLQALVADGLFERDGVFRTMPDAPLKPLEEILRYLGLWNGPPALGQRERSANLARNGRRLCP